MLRMGSVGPLVKELQGDLNLLPTELPPLIVDGLFGVRTDRRVREFQGLNALDPDGVVGELTQAAIDAALLLLKNIPQQPTFNVVAQKNPPNLTALHDATAPIVAPGVISSPPPNFRFGEVTTVGRIQEFLFRIEKSNSVFWMGAAVPANPSTLDHAYVVFHPTVAQQGGAVALDEDYEQFVGGWSQSMYRYVPLMGAQLAGAGARIPMLVPFTTMAAVWSPRSPTDNMFAVDPIGTIWAVLKAIEAELPPLPTPLLSPHIDKIGVASVSSGVTAMRNFVGAMAQSGLVKEIVDFDSPFIVGLPHALTTSPGAVSKCFSQVAPNAPSPGYVVLTGGHFSNVSQFAGFTPPNHKLHRQICTMLFEQVMAASVVP